jgi:CheY-like chemotaxis protein
MTRQALLLTDTLEGSPGHFPTLVRHTLERGLYLPTFAGTCEVLALARELRPAVILLDVPAEPARKAEALEIVAALQAEAPTAETPVVLFWHEGSHLPHPQTALLRYVIKPFTPNEVLSVVMDLAPHEHASMIRERLG